MIKSLRPLVLACLLPLALPATAAPNFVCRVSIS